MGGTTHQQRSVGLLKEEEWQCQSNHALTSHLVSWQHPLQCKHPNLKHRSTQQSLCIHALSNPFWVAQELRTRGLSPAQNGEILQQIEKVVHRKSSVCNEEVATYLGLLKACVKNKDLYRGTQLHDDILRKGLLHKCSDALATMYAKCGALAKAKELLASHKSKNIIAWTALIAGYARQDQGHDAWNCFECMQQEGLLPDVVIFACLLKACGSMKAIDKGEQVHDEITKQGLLGTDIVLGTALVDMYVKCGALAKAQRILEDLPSRDIISWNALIAGFAQEGQIEPALKCFKQMQQEGLSPDAATFTCILKVCGSTGAIDKGEQIHDEITRHGLVRNNIVLGTALMDMYVKCGALTKAQQVFEELPSRDAVAWSSLIAGYAQQGQGKQALDCFEGMQHEGLSPDALTFAFALKACSSIGAAYKGEQIHDEITRQGLLRNNNNVLGTALVDMYAKCGALTKAQQVLEELPSRDVVSWTALIAGYTQQGLGKEALNCFERMQCEGFFPDAVTFTYILKACSSIGACDKGEQIHDEITRQGLLGNNHVLGTALVDMYAKCGALAKARQVLDELPFRDSVSWNALIAGYAQRGQSEQALKCFKQMQLEGICPDAATFACILNVYGSKGETDKGEEIHDKIMKQGLLVNNTKLGSALVDMYAKSGALAKAQQVLEELSSPDIISWNALIAGYVQQGQGEKALNCFELIKREGLSPDVVTFACILKACGIMGLANKGEQIHNEISKQGLLGSSVVLGTALVDMYAKCGDLAKAQQVLEELPSPDVVSWNALITGYTQQGQVEQVLSCLEQMQHRGLSPNAVTFSCVLNACNHLGLVEDGHIYFMSISKKYGLKPELEHYTCMVDLYGRAGHLDKAVGVIQEFPSSNYSAVWSALLGACWKWGDVNAGRWAFEQALKVDKSEAAAYVLMANIYAAAGMQGDAEEIEAMRTENKAWKKPRLQFMNS